MLPLELFGRCELLGKTLRGDGLLCVAATKRRETELRPPEAIELLGGLRTQYMRTMLETLLPKSSTRVVVYLEPINVRWGARKLDALCREVMHIEPDASTCFLFANRRRDTLLLYFLDHDGDQTVTKKLDKGSFLLPAPAPEGAPFVILRPSVLPRMFRS